MNEMVPPRQEDIVIAGLPSRVLLDLSHALGIDVLENRAASGRPTGARNDSTGPELPGNAIRMYLDGFPARKIIVVFPAPWGFLEQRLAHAAGPLETPEQLEDFSRESLSLWCSYHGALLEARNCFADRLLIFNGHYPLDPGTISAIIHQRFALRVRPLAGHAVSGIPPAHEEVVWQYVNATRADCLELYAMLEACSELCGRSPSFGFDRFPRRPVSPDELLRIAQAGSAKRTARGLSGGSGGEIHILQLHQSQEELSRLFEENRIKDRKIAALQERLRAQRSPGWRRVAYKAICTTACIAERLPMPGLLRRRLSAAKSRLGLDLQKAVVRASGLFNDKWYLSTYPDVALAGMDPLEHYLKFGVSDGRNPSAEFDTLWYLRAYPDVANARQNPLLHYIEHGRYEGRRPRRRN